MTASPLSPTSLDYRSSVRPVSGGPPKPLVIIIGIVVACLTAEPFATAAGVAPALDISREPSPYIIRGVCGIIMFLLVCFSAGPIVRTLRSVITHFAGSAARPSHTASLVLIGCGTACLLATLAVELYLVRYGAAVISASGISALSNSAQQMTIGVQTPLFAQILTGLTFLAGVALAGIGI